MLYLIHGQDIINSRHALSELKAAYDDSAVSNFDSDANIDEIIRSGGASAMFSERRLMVIENYGRWPEVLTRSLAENLRQLSDTTDIIFWHDDEAPAKDPLLEKARKDGKVLFFKGADPSKAVFKFLDALGERRKREAYLELHQLLESDTEPIYILTMIASKVRNLLGAIYQNDKLLPTHPFARKKALDQAKNFDEETLIKIHRLVFEADLAMKSEGGSPELMLDRLVEEMCI